MKITLKKGGATSLIYGNSIYKCGEEMDLPFNEAVRLAEISESVLSGKKEKYNPELWKEGRFAFHANVDSYTGYGNCTLNLLRFSKRYRIAHIGKLLNISDSTVIRMNTEELDPGMAIVWHDQPRKRWLTSVFPKNIAITPFETTRTPQSWTRILNRIDALFVPCKQNIEAFRNSGIKIPIELIHWGVDDSKFYPLERNNSVFTFGTMGALSYRKGTDLLIEAFQTAFPTERDVRLLCKSSYTYYPFMVQDDRIKVELGESDNDDLLERFFKKIDCFVFPTRGEGFGLTPLEAMATGIPAIATGWSGITEYLNNDVGWLLDYTMAPATAFTKEIYKEECGEWAEPSFDDLVDKMRYTYEHPEEVKQKGLLSTNYVKQEWLWDNKIKMFHDALEKHL